MTIVGIMPVNVCSGTGPSLIVNTLWRQKQSVAYCEHPKVRAHTLGESVAYSNFLSSCVELRSSAKTDATSRFLACVCFGYILWNCL